MWFVGGGRATAENWAVQKWLRGYDTVEGKLEVEGAVAGEGDARGPGGADGGDLKTAVGGRVPSAQLVVGDTLGQGCRSSTVLGYLWSLVPSRPPFRVDYGLQPPRHRAREGLQRPLGHLRAEEIAEPHDRLRHPALPAYWLLEVEDPHLLQDDPKEVLDRVEVRAVGG